MAMKAKRKDSVLKTMTVKEFQAWTRGILELQGDDWVPNKSQWETIRNHIFALREDKKDNEIVKPVQFLEQISPQPKQLQQEPSGRNRTPETFVVPPSSLGVGRELPRPAVAPGEHDLNALAY